MLNFDVSFNLQNPSNVYFLRKTDLGKHLYDFVLIFCVVKKSQVLILIVFITYLTDKIITDMKIINM